MGDDGGIELSIAAVDKREGESPDATAAVVDEVPAEAVGMAEPVVPAETGKLMLPPRFRLCDASGREGCGEGTWRPPPNALTPICETIPSPPTLGNP